MKISGLNSIKNLGMKGILFGLILVLAIFTGCETEGLDGKNSLLDMIVEDAGDNCLTGGIRLVSGLDLNNNNVLENSEIQDTQYICNGYNLNRDFKSYLVKMSQSGTQAPLSNIVDNSLDLSITWVRESSGTYLGTLDRSLDLTKTVAMATPPSTHRNVYLQFVNNNSIRVKTEPYGLIYYYHDNWEDLILEIKEFY